MTFDDIRNMTGYSIRRLRQLIKDGLPHGTRKNPHGGKRILIFDQDKVEFYLAGRDLITPKQMEQALNEIAKGTQLKGRLSGGQPSLPPKPPTDKELLAMGYDPVSYRANEAALNDLINNPPEMPDLLKGPDPLADLEILPDPLIEMFDETEKGKPRRPVKTTSPD